MLTIEITHSNNVGDEGGVGVGCPNKGGVCRCGIVIVSILVPKEPRTRINNINIYK